MSIFSVHSNFRIVQRVEVLEKKILSKRQNEELTRAQKMLLLKHLGVLEYMNTLVITKKSKSQLLSSLINASSENIEKDLTKIELTFSEIATSTNYQVLVDTFEKAGLEKEKDTCLKILDNLHITG